MTEKITVTKGKKRFSWNGKIIGSKIVRLDITKADLPPETILHLHTPTPSKMNDAGAFQWLEGRILAHKRGYDRIKVAKIKIEDNHMNRPIKTVQRIVNAKPVVSVNFLRTKLPMVQACV